MANLDVPQFLGLLAANSSASAKILGAIARWLGQPAVLGELVAGVILGVSWLRGLVDPKNDVLHLMAEIGVVILLFEIGLETDLRRSSERSDRPLRVWQLSASPCHFFSGMPCAGFSDSAISSGLSLALPLRLRASE